MTTSTPGDGLPAQNAPQAGLLARVDRFDLWLGAVMLVVVATCAVRFVSRHGVSGSGVIVIVGALVLAVLYGAVIRMTTGQLRAVAATIGVAVVWGILTVVAPSFAWCAVPVAFAVLRVLPFWPALTVVGLMTALVPVAWWRLLDEPDPTVIVGPIALAVVIVVAYQALDRESRARQRLVDELLSARQDLAEADRREGALAERARLSREIHDSVGQGLSSVTLMLGAAAQEWDRDPAAAREHVRTAAEVTRASLDDVRRVVRDLAPAELTRRGPSGVSGLEAALRRVLSQAGPGLDTELRIHGGDVAIPPEIGTALTRTAQGALANVVEHSGASSVVVTLTRHRDEVSLDVYDDGRGFEMSAAANPRKPLRGHGLTGIAARAEALGGSSSVDSQPGSGTIVSVSFPLDAGVGRGG